MLKNIHVLTIVKLVKLLPQDNVSLVHLLELTLHIVSVKMDIMKIPSENVSNVEWNVSPVHPKLIVLNVPVTELTLHNVTVQLIIMILMKKTVHLAQMLVKNVIWMVTVPSVKLTETALLNVLVFLIILKPLFKEFFSVKFVTLDVKNVTTFSTCVKLVPPPPTEPMLQNVTAQSDT
jgi:hypothetical protein